MSTRRVKNVDYDEYEDGWDEDQDWGEGEWDGGDWDGGDWAGSEWAGGDWGHAHWNSGTPINPVAGKNKPAPANSAGKAASAKSRNSGSLAKTTSTKDKTTSSGVKKEQAASTGHNATGSGMKKAASTDSMTGGSSGSKAKATAKTAPGSFGKVVRAPLPGGSAGKEESPTGKLESPGQTAIGQAPMDKVSSTKSCHSKNAVETYEDDFMNAEKGLAIDELDTNTKPTLNIVIVGHVDAGKSTLMGHLLLKVGVVQQQALHKIEKEARQMGKESFKFAWVLDEGAEERERGVTVEICVKHFESESFLISILDAPGHRDLVPTMLQGAFLADLALLVVDIHDFDAGFHRSGQTKEHLHLLRACGVNRVLVGLNKMDMLTPKWNMEVYEEKKNLLLDYMTHVCGYKKQNVKFCPISGFNGENIHPGKYGENRMSPTGLVIKTLIETIDDFINIDGVGNNPNTIATGGTNTTGASTEEGDRCGVSTPGPTVNPGSGALTGTISTLTADQQLALDPNIRLPVSDCFPSGGNTIICGKLVKGTVRVGDSVAILPAGEQCTVKAITVRGTKPVSSVRAGFFVDHMVLNLDFNFMCAGAVLVNKDADVDSLLKSTLHCTLHVYDSDVPLVKGQQLIAYIGTQVQQCTLSKIVSVMKHEKKPKALQKGMIADVLLAFSQTLFAEPSTLCFSRIVLRASGSSVAAGLIRKGL